MDVAHTIGFACEDAVDHRVVTRIVDRLARREGDWIDDLESLRRYVDWNGVEGWAHLHRAAKELATRDRRGVRAKLHGKGHGPDFQSLRAAILLFDLMDPKPAAVVLVRDRDGKSERLESAREATVRAGVSFPAAIASPEPEIEAWIIRGFAPATHEEQERHADERRRLGFDPSAEPHRLSSTSDESKRDAKTVLSNLTNGDRDRQVECIERLCDLPHEGCGLESFLVAARALIQIVFLGRKPPA